jgi:hypothetical protein
MKYKTYFSSNDRARSTESKSLIGSSTYKIQFQNNISINESIISHTA